MSADYRQFKRFNVTGTSVSFRQARVNLDFQWPTVILIQGTR